MASKGHDFIVKMIEIKMNELDYKIVAKEEHYYNACIAKIKLPPSISNHRPDMIGYSQKDCVCIGEAKYYNDLRSSRTIEQLKNYFSLVQKSEKIYLIIGLPFSEMGSLLKILDKNNLEMNERITVLQIPDAIIP
jgi:hypothetical protein